MSKSKIVKHIYEIADFLGSARYISLVRIFSLNFAAQKNLSFFEKALDKTGDVWYTIEVESQDSRYGREIM